MKRIFIFFLVISFVISIFILERPLKSFIRKSSVMFLERLKYYESEANSYKTFTEENIVIDKDLVAFANDLILIKGKDLSLNIYGSGKVNVEAIQIDDKDLTEKILYSKEIEIDNIRNLVYSTKNGINNTNAKKLNIEIPNDVEGWISIILNRGKTSERNIPVFIQANLEHEIAFVEATDTLTAYNPAHNLYNNIPNYYRRSNGKPNSQRRAVTVPINAPYEYKSFTKTNMNQIHCEKEHLLNADLIHKNFLRSENINFSYVSDRYLDDFENIKDLKLLIFGSHNEYWTKKKATNLIRFVENGGNVLFLGGNHAWREIKRFPGYTYIQGNGILEEEEFSKLADNILGTYFDTSDLNTSAPYEVRNNNIWKENFDINIKNKSLIAKRGSLIGSCENKIFGGSSHETDKLLKSSNGFSVLAKGMNKINKSKKGIGGYKDSGADLVFKEFENGSKVLNFGSVGLYHSLEDPYIKELIVKFIKKSN